MTDEADIFGEPPAREGHFLLESGHHGERWLDLEALCLDVAPIRALARRLAGRVAGHAVDAVCGPLVEGAFVALMVAEQLALPFTYAVPVPAVPEREVRETGLPTLFPVAYRIPAILRPRLKGQRVAIVNDVVGAGSAVRGTLLDLRACGAVPVVIATLAVAGDSAARLADDNGLALETLTQMSNRIWTPADCPLCASGVPLEDLSPSA
jgi:orotate phosphoribosyltransferase